MQIGVLKFVLKNITKNERFYLYITTYFMKVFLINLRGKSHEKRKFSEKLAEA